ncbi:ABC transporter ATP-binding protein [Carboxydichorda subterranea]
MRKSAGTARMKPTGAWWPTCPTTFVRRSPPSSATWSFLGRNGAGKTTTIRILLGLVHPTRGEAYLFGQRTYPGHQALLRRVGVVVEQPGFYPNLTAYENLALHARMLGLPEQRQDPVARALSLVGMDDMSSRLLKGFSQGERQRLALARALMHEPELLVLDEPTNGLDPYAIRDLRELLRRLHRERGLTIFISSHILAEVQKLCTRIGIIHEGRVVEEIGLTELRRRSRRYLEIEVTDAPKTAWVLENELGISDFLVIDASTVHVFDAPDPALLHEHPEAVTEALVRHGVGVRRMAFGQDSLEQHFIRVTGGRNVDDLAGLR